MLKQIKIHFLHVIDYDIVFVFEVYLQNVETVVEAVVIVLNDDKVMMIDK